MSLDTQISVETPEGVDLHAETAGVVSRTLAFSIDFAIRLTIIFILFLAISWTGAGGLGVIFIVWFLLEWFYPVFFEVTHNGQTIGKKAMSIKVVNQDLTPIRFGSSLIRNLLRAADFLPFMYVFGIIAMVLNKNFQRLGDMAAGTIVIYTEEETIDINSLNDITPIAPTHRMNADLQSAFINFALNRGNLSEARQVEIAQIIADKIPPQFNNSAQYVRGVGKWYLGGK